ncbi:MAG: hypothetical protein AAGJ35_07635, partial [Myxococcota bacterium]
PATVCIYTLLATFGFGLCTLQCTNPLKTNFSHLTRLSTTSTMQPAAVCIYTPLATTCCLSYAWSRLTTSSGTYPLILALISTSTTMLMILLYINTSYTT